VDDEGTRNIFSGSADNVVQAGQIHGGVHFHLPAKAAPIPHQLPPRRQGFTGRSTQLDALLGMLAPDADADTVVMSAVAGLPGVGKTALAIEAAQIAVERGWFAGGQLFLDLRGYGDEPLTAEQALGTLLRGLGVPEAEVGRDVDARAAKFRSTLADSTEPVLVLADNASSVDQVAPLLPGDRRHRVLITSRHTLSQLDARLLDLGVLTPAESIDLMKVALRNKLPEDTRLADQPETAEAVARLCGYLPLALRIVTALLAATSGMPVAELAEELADERKLDRLDDQWDAVRVAFDLSYRRLSAPEARLFRLTAINPGPDFSSQTAAALAETDEPGTRRILDELARAHLIDPDTDRLRWSMHDLIREYAGQAARTDETPAAYEQARNRLLHHYLHKAKAAEDDWLGAELANLIAAVSLAAASGEDAIARDLPAALGGYLATRHNFTDRLTVDVIRQQAAYRLGDWPGLAAAGDSVGYDLNQLSRFKEAETTLNYAMSVFQTLGDRKGEGEALNHLGTALRGQRRFDEAIDTCRRSVELLPNSVSAGGPLDNPAISLLAAGREAEAAEVWERVQFGPGSTDFGIHPKVQFIFGDVRLQMERMNALQRELKIVEETGDRSREGQILLELCGVLQNRGYSTEEALSHAARAAAIFAELGDKVGESAAMVAAARVLREEGEADRALPFLQRAADISRAAGDKHGEGTALSVLGRTLIDLKRLDFAAEVSEAAATILHEVGDGREEGSALKNLAYCRLELRQHHASVAAGRRAVAVCRESGDRKFEAVSLCNLGRALLETNAFDESATVNEQAVDLLTKMSEPPLQAWVALKDLGRAYLELGRYQESIDTSQRALSTMDDAGDSERGETNGNLATALVNAGRHAEAIEPYREAAAACRRLRRPDTEGFLQLNLAKALMFLHRHEEALPPSLRAAEVFADTGDRNGEATALFCAGHALTGLGRLSESPSLLRGSLALHQAIGDREGETRATFALAAVLVDTGKLNEGILLSMRAAELFREAGNRHNEAQALRFVQVALAKMQPQ
jgi:tetratricopeptide (TPR) repeat protein